MSAPNRVSCRVDLQDGRQVILSATQTLEERQALASIRASVENQLRERQTGGAEPIEFCARHAHDCHTLLRQRWFDSVGTCKQEVPVPGYAEGVGGAADGKGDSRF